MTVPSSTPITDFLLWAFALLCVTTILVSPVACTVSRQNAIVEAIKAGADPIAAKCAIDDGTASSPVCVAYAIKERK